MPDEIRNMPASVHARLLNRSRQSKRPFQEMLEYYAMERFLYRLAASRHARKFILKGGLMLPLWGASVSRPTRDIDLLGRTGNEVEAVVALIRDVCGQPTEDDGLVFDGDSCLGEMINPEKEYPGVRVRFTAYLERAKIPMQVDVGFGDLIVPGEVEAEYPTILGHRAAKILVYTRESVVAEKLEAMVKWGEVNSRTKDFLDIWLLSRLYDFSGDTLSEAVKITFDHRGTSVRPDPVCLTAAFAEDAVRQAVWQGLVRTSRVADVPNTFAEVIEGIATFATPVLKAIAASAPFTDMWTAPGPWSARS